MTQVEIENVLREFNAEIAELEIERDKAQEEMMSAKIAWINADTDERKTAMQVNFERVRFEQEKKCRHIRARIDELKRVAKVDILKATNERDSLYRQLAGQLTEKYNAKVRSLKDERFE